METILGNTGHHDLSRTDGPLGYWGERQKQAVEDWQSQKGLRKDGTLLPGGPTITSLKQAAGGLLGGFTPPSPDEVDEHHSKRMQGEPGLLNTRPARLSFPRPHQPLDLDEQSQAFNADTAGALTRSSVNGHIPDIYANFAKQAGPDAHATLMDLAEQMNSKVGRDRTDQVMHGIVNRLPPDQAKTLLGGTMPAPRPLGVRNADLPDDSAVPLFQRTAAAPVAGGGTDVLSQAENSEAAAIVAPPPPAAPEEKPVHVAAAPAAIPLAAWLLGGGAAVGGAIAQQQIEKELKKPKGLPTTTIDPQAGKPQVLHGPDPSKPPPQTATPPSMPTPQPPPLLPGQPTPAPAPQALPQPDGSEIQVPTHVEVRRYPTGGLQPDVDLWDKRNHDGKAAEHQRWYETQGKKLEAEIAADPSRRRLHPSESFIWKNLKPGNNGYKTNGEGMIFGFDRGGGTRHNAEIEVWDKKTGIHQFTIDPITGKKTKGSKPRKNLDPKAFGALEFPIFS